MERKHNLSINPNLNPSVDKLPLNDNRRYEYASHERQFRAEYPVIESWITPGARIVDFGCGNGALIEYIRERKQIQALGFDCAKSGVEICRTKGIAAEVRSIDQLHPDLQTGQYDFAICNVTIQMTMYPEVLFHEMVRVAKFQIISFPNFAFFRNRVDLLFRGRMPQYMLYRYAWFNTGHVHQLSIADFQALVSTNSSISILQMKGCTQDRNPIKRKLRAWLPNLLEQVPVFLLGPVTEL